MDIQDLYELAPLQQGMLFHTLEAGPQDGAYLIQIACRLRGELDVPCFERAWRHVADRHAVLRTSFHWRDVEKPLQVVHRDAPLRISRQDWRGVPRSEQGRRIAEFAEADLRRGFDLGEPPLVRLALIALGEHDHHFFWTFHHIILEGWSASLLIEEVMAFYRADRRGESFQPRPVRPYRDYILWLQQQDASRAEAFWRRTLRGFSAPTPLVADRPAALAEDEARYAERAGTIPPDASAALASMARSHRLTLNTLVQGAWALLLSRYSGEDDVLFGTVVSGRPHSLPGSQEMIGLFVNTLVARVEVDWQERLVPWLKRLQDQQLEMREYEYSSLLDVHGWSEMSRGVPPFESILVFENWLGDISFSGWTEELEVSEVTCREGATGFPLTVGAKPGPELSLPIAFDRRRFAPETVDRLLGHFRTLLCSMAADPERRLWQLPLLTPQEARTIEVEWNATETDFPRDACLSELFETQVERTPEATAVAFGAESLTYRELNTRANRLAHHLRRLGVGPEVLVGLYVERSLDLLVGPLAILKAGGCYVPLDPAYPPERLGYMLEDSGLSTLLTQSALLERLPRTNARALCLDSMGGELARESAANPPVVACADNLAYVIYTSGSTGRPKGVQVRHRSLVNLMLAMAREPGLQSGDVWLSPTTLSFDMAVPEVYLPLVAGGCVALLGRDDAADGLRLKQKLEAHGATVLQATPTTWRLLLEAGWQGDGRLKMLCGAESWTRELADQLLPRGSSLWNLYGPTETTVWSTVARVEPGEDALPVGRPFANTQIHLLDRRGQTLPVGVIGEVFIGGDGMARGYRGRPDLTAEKFVPNPFGEPGTRLYRTGDLARYLPDGRIECVGRVDHQVKLRGFRIELGEIESVLSRHEEVAQAAVIIREDVPDQKRLVAYVVPGDAGPGGDEAGPARPAMADRLRRYLKQALPDYMVPAWYVFLEALPLNPNGKVDRRALPKPDAAALGSDHVAPRNEVERLLAVIWEEVLGTSQAGVRDNFFDAGGHSLLAMRLVSRVQEIFGVEVSVRRLFDDPTLEGLAAALKGRAGTNARRATPIAPASRDRPLSLSFAQERLWFLEQLAPHTPVHTIPFGLRLTGRLDLEALERSLAEIQRRHESVRTTFGVAEGMPAQRVAAAGALLLETTDLSGAPDAAARENERRRLLREAGERSLDLGRGPLLRWHLVRLAAEDHLLVLSAHHIVFDGWSLGVVVKELAALYGAYREGRPSPLPELTVQYADFAAWQREWLAEAEHERQLAYWKKRLAGLPVLALPSDRARPAMQSFGGGQRSFALSTELSHGLKALGRQEGATPFMTLLAAFQALLSRYAGQDDVAVGSPVAGRVRPDLEGLIGLFVNMLVLRGDLSGNPTFQELLARVREAALEAYGAQDVPFERLVQELRPGRDLSRSPLFQVMFVLQNAPLPAVELPGLSLTAEAVERHVAQFDLALYMEETAAGFAGALEYNTDLFEPASVDRMIGHFQTMLQAIATEPGSRVRDLPLLTGTELSQFGAWNATGVGYSRGSLLTELIEGQALRRGDAVAAEFGEERLTYEELNGRANALAEELSGLGVGPGVLVGIYMERSLEMLVSVLGVLKAGGAYVPLDPAYPSDRVSYMLEDSGAGVLLTQESLRGTLSAGGARVVCVERGYGAGSRRGNLGRRCESEDLAYVIYTSGSTGRPKGVQVTHRSVVNFLESMAREPGLGERDALLSVTTLSFDIAGLELYLPLTVGGRVVLVSREEASDGERLLKRLKTSGATAMQATPATWRLLLEAGWSGDRGLKVLCGGEALTRELAERLLPLGSSVWNLYGPTETTIWSTLWQVSADGGPVTVGRPIANTRTYALDGRGRRVPVGVPGELCIGGEGLARGYLKRADLTAERFVPDPYAEEPGARMYRTGDLVRFLADGRIEWLSRLDHQVKVRGYRIELGEIESVLSRQSGVRQAVVMVREDVAGDARLVAYVLGEEGSEPGVSRPQQAGRLREALLSTLPDYMVPTSWVFLEAFPLTPNGKVDRKALPRPEAQRAGTEYAAPETATDRVIAGVWQEVLRLERVGLHDNFFDLGGHSLLLMQVQAKLRRLLEREIPIVDLFQHPTIAALGRHLRNGTNGGPAGPVEEETSEKLQADRQRVDRLQQLRRQQVREER